ncbi:MAG: helix-turn-helix transcriptional regulator [Proteobacteria bacterium]|jgi:transcriptional regulator with XRE-family HTH domain|nr:helix-turn-helix transcriptional regulator [Pseudomonadota bacterium]
MATNEEVLAGIGRRIAEIRTNRNLTQAQVAEAINIGVQYLQIVEAGRQNLTISTLNRLAVFLPGRQLKSGQ